jgi:hypothetical protein
MARGSPSARDEDDEPWLEKSLRNNTVTAPSTEWIEKSRNKLLAGLEPTKTAVRKDPTRLEDVRAVGNRDDDQGAPLAPDSGIADWAGWIDIGTAHASRRERFWEQESWPERIRLRRPEDSVREEYRTVLNRPIAFRAGGQFHFFFADPTACSVMALRASRSDEDGSTTLEIQISRR